jgi:hypothetical protein
MADRVRETTARTPKLVRPHRDAAIALVAEGQHGIVSLEQLLSLGLSRSAIGERARRGGLVRLHRGVFAVGHAAIRPEGHWLAAVLACGEGALLTHRSAAALWDLRPTSRARIDVTVPRRGTRAHDGIDVHTSTTLAPADATRVRDIPCTSVARTLLDLAGVVGGRSLARAFDRAEILRLLDLRALEEVICRNPGRHGLRPLRALLATLDPQRKFARSDLEELFLALCARSGLPQPIVNGLVAVEGGHLEVDLLWLAHQLVAETDGFETHRSRLAFERDRRRDQLLLREGYRTVRFTWRQLNADPEWVAATVRKALALAGDAVARAAA